VLRAGLEEWSTIVASSVARSTAEARMPVTYELAGRTAVVTGGAGRIGRAIAGRLRQSGARVVVWDIAPRDQDGVTSLVVDVTDPDQVASAVLDTLDDTERIDILVHSAGYLGSYGPFQRQAAAEWPGILGANLLGVLEVCRQVLPHMPRTRPGRVVTIGSLAGKHGLANLSVYSAASAGVIAFTKALAEELAGTEIRVNCVAPGPIDTELITRLGPAVVESMVASSPMQRLGTADEVAEVVLWLCSDACSFTTGAVFDVSGGRAKY
jgi:NAD(P)-dependent dehydrogenase (short-subunit alcohol dehydrogenase family)